MNTLSPQESLQGSFHNAQQQLMGVLEQLKRETTTLLQTQEPSSGDEELKKAMERAQEATKMKDKFVSLVAHDLKSPLGAMLGLLELIDSDPNHPLAPEQREMLHFAMQSGEQMVKLIKNLLDISRLQSGKITLDPQFMDGQILVKDIITRIGHLADRKGITLVNNVAQYTRVRGDRHLLAEVVQNLLTNAIKFSHSGQVVRVESSYDSENDHILLHISDEGVGISQAEQEKLFRVEEKSSTMGTAGEKGTGFGLPFSQDIMLAHQGKLSVTSQPGKGSRFTMHLPQVKPRILLVDDLRTARLMFRSILSSLNVEVQEAGDGREALSTIEHFQPHLVISDIIMPEMDGFELLSHIKSKPATAGIHVIMVTTDESIETRELSFALGAEDFVTKPVILCDFMPRIRRLVV
ncbi:MAG: hybrid sensor histidine kinase/response regulator [Magnetococcales bacterium]|nr:hybrid sensor histidine kinase/response regulator [Magnetococcales bacterium]NGZ29000.1 hybrid sensor histidine kinase/response regulator [Magnetococcales bacterium]